MAAPAPANHYDTLGLSRSATADQVRRAYRRLARLHHPDVSDKPDTAARFAALQNAYSVLSDRRKRAEYDARLDTLHAPGRNGEPASRPHYSWRNVATDATPDPDAPRSRTDLDEMYDAFFGGKANAE